MEILVILALYVAMTTQYVTKNINELNDTTYEAILNEPEKFKLVKFYMPTCGHCMNFKPAFESVSNKLKKYISTHTYNISDNGSLASKLSIDSAPRLFIFKSLSDYKEINTRDPTQIIEQVTSFYFADFKATKLSTLKEKIKNSSFFYFYIGSSAPLHILDFIYKEKINKVPVYKLRKAPKFLKKTNIKQDGLFSYNKGSVIHFNNQHTDKAKYMNNFKWRSERGHSNFVLIKENSCLNKFANSLDSRNENKQNKNEIIFILVVNNSNKKNNKKLSKAYNDAIDSFHNSGYENKKLKRYFVLDLYNNGNTNLLDKLKKSTYGQVPPLMISINKEKSKMKPLFLSKIQGIEAMKKYIIDDFKSVEDDKATYRFPLSSFDLKTLRFMNNEGFCSDRTLNKFRDLSNEDLKKHSYTSAPLLVLFINYTKYMASESSNLSEIIEKLEELPNYILNIKNYTLENETSLSITFKGNTKKISLKQTNAEDIVKQVKGFVVEALKDTEDIPQYINHGEDSDIDKKADLQKAIRESGSKHKIIILNKKLNKKKMNKLKILKEILKDNFAIFIADRTTLPELNFPPKFKNLKTKKMEFILLLAPIAETDEPDEDQETETIVKFDSYYYNGSFDFKDIISFISSKRLQFDLDLLNKKYKPLNLNVLTTQEDLKTNCESVPCVIKLLRENKDFDDIAEISRNDGSYNLYVIGKDNFDSFKGEEWFNNTDFILYTNGRWTSVKGNISGLDLENEITLLNKVKGEKNNNEETSDEFEEL